MSTDEARPPPPVAASGERRDVAIDLGWGRLVIGRTFTDESELAALLRTEELGQRDICLYHREPHVLVSRVPHELFVDPSHTYRRMLDAPIELRPSPGVRVREMRDDVADADAVNRIFASVGMVVAPVDVLLENNRDPSFVYLISEDVATGQVVGTVAGIDHVEAFGDEENGSSLWTLAVDPQTHRTGVGEDLTRRLLSIVAERGRAFLDLSVMHDNTPAIALYAKLGFVRVPVFAVKRKNPINEPLFVGPEPDDYEGLNPYARIIADEARRRGITVDVIDAELGFLRLSYGGRQIVTRESLSELTSGVAVSWTDDKRVSRRLFERAGLHVPRGRASTTPQADDAFLAEVGEVVVKPARGEQGTGITVGVTTPAQLARAVDLARRHCPDVLLEEYCEGDDLRVVVIDGEVVAAAIRRPAAVHGDGVHTVGELIEVQSRRRAGATGGESRIPVDETTVAVVRDAGRELDDVLPEGDRLDVRRTANLHTGGTIHDVTADLHPDIASAAVQAAKALSLPVTGLDFLVASVSEPEYVLIEANERPGLANHEPQPTAQRFIDLLFPSTTTSAMPTQWTPWAASPRTS